MQNEIQQIVKKLQLLPHPEGGFYRETYRCETVIPQSVLGYDFNAQRNVSTCIYFMLVSGNFSAFHRIKQDEIWHFYRGSALRLYMISLEGKLSKVKIGSDILNGEMPQFVVPAGYWFAAEVIAENSYSLVGCTVAPGFDFADFELGDKVILGELFPNHKEIIEKYCR
ncbi:MAG TPA: cupin domain-containing protein [Bacteroidales bacterium]|nr:cupin domain-containing protein [Bacteroidales bacterium]